MERLTTNFLELITLLIFWGLLVILWIMRWPPSLHQTFGTICGATTGIVASVYHNRNWDWGQGRWHDNRRSVTPPESLGCLIPLATAAGVLTSRYGLVEALVGDMITEFLMFFGLAGFAILMSYMIVQGWRYAGQKKHLPGQNDLENH